MGTPKAAAKIYFGLRHELYLGDSGQLCNETSRVSKGSKALIHQVNVLTSLKKKSLPCEVSAVFALGVITRPPSFFIRASSLSPPASTPEKKKSYLFNGPVELLGLGLLNEGAATSVL